MKLLVTGGAGFIGSNFVHHILRSSDIELLINLDKLTYAGHLDNLKGVTKDKRYRFVRGDIASTVLVRKLIKEVDTVINFAAETHVDRSIQNAAPFLHTNVLGTQVLLAAALDGGIKRFLHISTDEVYGSISRGFASEDYVLNPSSPYAASKASADHLVLAYFKTFGLPVLITRAANNYGPYQYPEKFLPLFITHALEDKPLPLYGDGKNVRDWLHVSDHCSGIDAVLRRGEVGGIYNIGTGRGFSNVDVAYRILAYLGKPQTLIRFIPDRLGHDRRYAMNVSRLRSILEWQPAISFQKGLKELIHWYQVNESWWKPILHYSKTYKHYYSRQYSVRRRE